MHPDNLNVFDLDGTLIKVNSFRKVTICLIITLLKRSHVSGVLKLISWYVIRKLGLLSHLEFKRNVVNIFEMLLPEKEKVDIVQEVFNRHLNKQMISLMLKAENCIISSAAPYAYVSRMSFKDDAVIISSLDPENDWPDPGNSGPGKIENIRKYFDGFGIRVSKFYTDSRDDQALIDFSDTAFIVKKDRLVKVK